MADMSFDVVFAGGGYGALMSAPYFCMNGMSVGIFEALPELGGGHASDARPLPGFTANPHAHGLVAHLAPQLRDFKLWEKGGLFYVPEKGISVVFSDGTGLKINNASKWNMYTGESSYDYALLEENYESLAKISKKDAETTKEMVQKLFRGWMYAVMMDWMNPPPPYGEKEWLEKFYDDPDIPIDPRWQYMTVVELARELFDHPKFQMFFIRLCGAMANWPDRAITPTLMLLQAMVALGVGAFGQWEGGTHQVVHALQRVLADYGAKTFVNSKVDKVLVENGRAKGIKLVDGTEIEAKKLVVTNVDPRALTFQLLRDFPISETIKKKVNNIQYDIATLFWGNIATHELPQYIAEDFCPGVGGYFAIFMGDDDVDYLFKEYRYHTQHIRPGQWPPKMYYWVCPYDLYDPRVAPAGKHTFLIEEYGPPASALSEREWLQVRREIGPRLLQEWRKFAPNMTEDNIIGVEIDTPGDFVCRDPSNYEGSWQMGVAPTVNQWSRYRPITEYSRYKVPGIENLYCTGIAWHSNFGSPAGFAYNMYKVAAADLGLREFWKEEGRDW